MSDKVEGTPQLDKMADDVINMVESMFEYRTFINLDATTLMRLRDVTHKINQEAERYLDVRSKQAGN